MRLSLLVIAAGCGFEHGVPGTGSDVPPDARQMDAATSDGAMLMPPTDAPPCLDDDADGVCNTADDWPCGGKPDAPAATVAFSNNNGATTTTITQVTLGATARLAVAAPLEDIGLTLTYDIDDAACLGNCIDQVEIGWVPGGRVACVFDGVVPKNTGVAGTVSVNVRAPMSKQVYDLRVNLGQNFSCNAGGANSWWGGTPAATKTIAKLCVH